MDARLEALRSAPFGRAIADVARRPERLAEYRLLSRLGLPAVIALSWDAAPILREVPGCDRKEAEAFCDAVVGEVLAEHGFELATPEASAAAGGVFASGAVWREPSGEDDAQVAAIVDDLMRRYATTLEALAR